MNNQYQKLNIKNQKLKCGFTPVPESPTFQRGDEWESAWVFRCGVSAHPRKKPRPLGWGGFTLVEMLVALMIFSILGILVTRTLVLSLRGVRKSESIALVRENVSFAMGIMEQHLRNAKDLDCTGIPGSTLNYIDSYGNSASFGCVDDGTDIYIASNSAQLTSDEVAITNTNCRIFTSCTEMDPVNDVPDSVTIEIQASTVESVGAEGFQVSSQTKVLLRTYSF